MYYSKRLVPKTRTQTGQSALEYALVLALISLLFVGLFLVITPRVGNVLSQVDLALAQETKESDVEKKEDTAEKEIPSGRLARLTKPIEAIILIVFFVPIMGLLMLSLARLVQQALMILSRKWW